MKILYFAWLRERLNRDEQELTPPPEVTDISRLMDWMCENDQAIALAFENRDLIKTALDEEIVAHDTSLKGAKTIAFFPPMTGG
ncbi:Molybdopterin synthase sulfur carrier subunit [hydrothermal vent metagenome]|uniref:Molybdopterin synthase sulfur carrier subunit n=1 Tax=hydrothermal vent metagenome TaxID=652676 RepID=A0A3B0TMQ8_9ZZZZ